MNLPLWPAGVELLFFSLLSSANDQQHSSSSHTGRLSRCGAKSFLIRLNYCIARLGGLNNRQLDHLQRVQNSAARVIYRVRQRENITPTLRTLHWLPIRMRIICFVERYMPVRALRSSCSGILLKVIVPRKTIGQSSFSVAAHRCGMTCLSIFVRLSP